MSQAPSQESSGPSPVVGDASVMPDGRIEPTLGSLPSRASLPTRAAAQGEDAATRVEAIAAAALASPSHATAARGSPDESASASMPALRTAWPRQRTVWRGWWWLAAALVLVLASAVMFRSAIADWMWPQNRAQALREQAEAALRSGRLTAADGRGARELYAAALAIDPDRNEARDGLQRVANAALAQADAAARANDFARAHEALQLARSLSAPREAASRVETLLRTREAAHAGLPTLLARAEAARSNGQLVGGDGAALPLYARVLALQPDNGGALKGREDALSALLEQARTQLREGDIAGASAAIAQAKTFDSGHIDLPDTQARLNEELDDVRRVAAADLRAQRLEAALAQYRSLEAAGADADAAAGIDRVAKAYADRASVLASDFAFVQARSALAAARALRPALPELADAERHIARAEQSQAHLAHPLPAREAKRRVAALLADAAAAKARGDLLLPPGESAFDKLRAARALAPNDPDVRRASARLLPEATRCFERAMSDNDLARARTCLDASAIVDPDSRSVAAARRRLSERWLAVGDERLAAGRLSAAQAALDSARAVDPYTPGIAPFAERLRVASAR